MSKNSDGLILGMSGFSVMELNYSKYFHYFSVTKRLQKYIRKLKHNNFKILITAINGVFISHGLLPLLFDIVLETILKNRSCLFQMR